MGGDRWVAVVAMVGRPRKRGVAAEALDLEARRGLLDIVSAEPGAHLRDIARAVGLNPAHAQYHLDRLVSSGLVTAVRDGGFRRFYPRSNDGIPSDVHTRDAKRALAALRSKLALGIVLLLLRDGPLPLQALASELRRAPSTLSYHLRKLDERGVVVAEGASRAERTYALVDPQGIEHLLVQHPPRRDLLAGFVDLWDGLALGGR